MGQTTHEARLTPGDAAPPRAPDTGDGESAVRRCQADREGSPTRTRHKYTGCPKRQGGFRNVPGHVFFQRDQGGKMPRGKPSTPTLQSGGASPFLGVQMARRRRGRLLVTRRPTERGHGFPAQAGCRRPGRRRISFQRKSFIVLFRLEGFPFGRILLLTTLRPGFLRFGRSDLQAKLAGMLPVKSLLDGHGNAAGALAVVAQHLRPRDRLQHSPMATRNRKECEHREEEAELAEHRVELTSRIGKQATVVCEIFFQVHPASLSGSQVDSRRRTAVSAPVGGTMATFGCKLRTRRWLGITTSLTVKVTGSHSYRPTGSAS